MESLILNNSVAWEDKNEQLRAMFRARQRDVTQMLSPKTLTRIKALFDEYEEQGGIRLPAFCELMERVLGAFVASRVDFFCQLVQVFREIDANDDLTLEWNELTTHVLELGRSLSVDAAQYFATTYRYSLASDADRNAHSSITEGTFLCAPARGLLRDVPRELPSESGNAASALFGPQQTIAAGDDTGRGYPVSNLILCAWEGGSPRLRVYRPTYRQQMAGLQGAGAMMHDTAFKPHEVLAACHAQLAHCFVTASQEGAAGPFFLSFYDDQTHALLKRVETRTAVVCLTYAESMGLVYACGKEPRAIRGWDPGSCTVKQRVPQVGGAATCMAVLPGHVDKTLLTGGTDGCIHVYDLRTAKGREGLSLAAHEMGVLQVRIARRLRVAVSIGMPVTTERACPKQYNTALVWDLDQWLGAGEQFGLSDLDGGSGFSAGPSAVDMPGREEDEDGLFMRSGGGGEDEAGGDRGGLEEENRHEHEGLEIGRTASGRRIRPGVLHGHEYGLVAVAIQDDEGVLPHVVTADCGGFVRVWHPRLCHCLQVFSPVLPSKRLPPPAALGGVPAGPGGVPRAIFLQKQKMARKAAEKKRRKQIEDVENPDAVKAATSQAYGSAMAQRRALLEEQEEDQQAAAGGANGGQRLAKVPVPRGGGADLAEGVLASSSIDALDAATSARELQQLEAGSRGSNGRAVTPGTFRKGGRRFQLIKQTGDLKEDSIDRFAHSQAVTIGAMVAAGIQVGGGDADESGDTEKGARTEVGNTEISLRIQSQAEAVGRRMSVSQYAQAIGALKQSAQKDEDEARGISRGTVDEDDLDGGDEDWWADPTQLQDDEIGGGAAQVVPASRAGGAASSSSSRRPGSSVQPMQMQRRRRNPISNAGISHRNRQRMLKALRSLECLPCEVGGPERRPTLALIGDRVAVMSFQQVVPELEPVVACVWLYPTLCIATACPSAVVVWDALVGRPLRVVSARNLCYRGADITCMKRDRRGRKLLVGDSAGGVHAINLATAAAAKSMDPVWANLRVDEQEQLMLGRGRQAIDRPASSASGRRTPRGQEQLRAAVVDMHYLASRQEVVYSGANGRVIAADDLPLEGWQEGQPNSLVLRRFAPPDVRDIDQGSTSSSPRASSRTGPGPGSEAAAAVAMSVSASTKALGNSLRRLPIGTSSGSAGSLPRLPMSQASQKLQSMVAYPSDVPVCLSETGLSCTAASDRLNLLATASPGVLGEQGAPLVLLWQLDKPVLAGAIDLSLLSHYDAASSLSNTVAPGGGQSSSAQAGAGAGAESTRAGSSSQPGPLSDPEQKINRLEVVAMRFLEPYAALLIVTAAGHHSVWAVGPCGGPDTLRAFWQHPTREEGAAVSAVEIARTSLAPRMLHGTMGPHNPIAAAVLDGASQAGPGPARSSQGHGQAAPETASLEMGSSGEVPLKRVPSRGALEASHGLTLWTGDSTGAIHRWMLPADFFEKAGLPRIRGRVKGRPSGFDARRRAVGAQLPEGVTRRPGVSSSEPGATDGEGMLAAIDEGRPSSSGEGGSSGSGGGVHGLIEEEDEDWEQAYLRSALSTAGLQEGGAAGRVRRSKEVPGKRVSLRDVAELLRMAESSQQSLHTQGFRPLREAMPCSTEALCSPVWEGAWMGHTASIRDMEYSTEGQALATASLDGLTRIWDGDGRLLGTLDTTPRFMAPAPHWSGVVDQARVLAETEKEAAEARRAARLAVEKAVADGSASEGEEEQEEAAGPKRRHRGGRKAVYRSGGVGVGSSSSDDKESMRHVAVLRRYKRSQARVRTAAGALSQMGTSSRSILSRLGTSSRRGLGKEAEEDEQEADALAAQSELERSATKALAPHESRKGLASSHVFNGTEPSPLGKGRCVVAVERVSGGERPGTVFAGPAPRHGPVTWHFRMDLVTRTKKELDDARDVMRMVSMIRMRRKGKGFQAKAWLQQRRASKVQGDLEGDDGFEEDRKAMRSGRKPGPMSEQEQEMERRRRDDDAARAAMNGPDVMGDEFRQEDKLESLVGTLVSRKQGGLVGDQAVDAAVLQRQHEDRVEVDQKAEQEREKLRLAESIGDSEVHGDPSNNGNSSSSSDQGATAQATKGASRLGALLSSAGGSTTTPRAKPAKVDRLHIVAPVGPGKGGRLAAQVLAEFSPEKVRSRSQPTTPNHSPRGPGSADAAGGIDRLGDEGKETETAAQLAGQFESKANEADGAGSGQHVTFLTAGIELEGRETQLAGAGPGKGPDSEPSSAATPHAAETPEAEAGPSSNRSKPKRKKMFRSEENRLAHAGTAELKRLLGQVNAKTKAAASKVKDLDEAVAKRIESILETAGGLGNQPRLGQATRGREYIKMHKNLGQCRSSMGLSALPVSKLSMVEQSMLETSKPGTVCAAVRHIRKARERAGSIGGTMINPLRQAAKEALRAGRGAARGSLDAPALDHGAL